MTDRPDVTEYREDISRFMVHLTRDDSDTDDEEGQPALDNFLCILTSKRIAAIKRSLIIRQAKMLDRLRTRSSDSHVQRMIELFNSHHRGVEQEVLLSIQDRV